MEIKAKAVKLFCSVVETGSLLSAANKCAVSASAASRIVTQLEERLGFTLFNRDSKTLTLTEDGKAFYRTAEESMRAWRVMEDFPRQHAARLKQVRVAVLARHCSDVIIPAVVKVLKAHEKTLRVAMDVHQSRDIYYSKFTHPFDVGFGTLLSHHDDLKKIAIAHLPFRLVVSRDHPLAGKTSVSKTDYAHERFILLTSDNLEHEYSAGLLPELSPDQVVAEVSSTQVALRYVMRGVGVHITDQLASIGVSSKCAVIPLEDKLTIPFYVFWPSAAGALRPELAECVREIASNIKETGIALTPEGEAYLRGETPA